MNFPENEKDLWRLVKESLRGDFYMERVEPKNECGYPDVHLVRRGTGEESALELKIGSTSSRSTPAMVVRRILRPTQITAFVDYRMNGGRRRFLLFADKREKSFYFWDTKQIYQICLGVDIPPFLLSRVSSMREVLP